MAKRERTGATRALFIVALVALTGCGCGADAAAPGTGPAAPGPTAVVPPSATRPVPSTTSSPGTTTSRWTPEQQEVIDAFNRAIDVEHRASGRSDPDDPELPETHVDPMLDKLRTNYKARHLVGQRTRFPEPSAYRVGIESVELPSQTVARIEHCVVDDELVYEAASGRIVNGEVATAEVLAVLQRTQSGWKLSQVNILSRQEGVGECVGES